MKTSMGCLTSSFRYEKLEEGLGEGQKTVFGRITFGFLSGIIQTGNENPLEEADLSSLDLQGTQHLTEKLEDKWQRGDQNKKRKLFSTELVERFVQSCRQKGRNPYCASNNFELFLPTYSTGCTQLSPGGNY